MINEESVQSVNKSSLNETFGKPLYDSYGFAQIPNTILSLLTGENIPGRLPPKILGHFSQQYDRVILLFLDAFGWRFVQRYMERYPFLARFMNEGVVTKLTSQFPSTTSAHVTTIHTGMPVGESGIYEWHIYEPTLDALITPLRFSYAKDHESETLRRTSANPKTLYPRHTFYHTLAERGIPSYVFQHSDIVLSSYSRAVTEGARRVPYRTFPEALINLAALVTQDRAKAYYFLYFDAIDLICHLYGPESPQLAVEIDSAMTTLERVLHANLDGKASNTLLLVTADHGQTEVNPETIIYLNNEIPHIEGYIKTNRNGELLVPAGSARDMFLHIKPEFLEEAHMSLAYHLKDKAEVYRVSELITKGFFGPVISDVFRERVADLVILPYRYQQVWWYHKDRPALKFMGHHGGLTRDEMEISLLALPYD